MSNAAELRTWKAIISLKMLFKSEGKAGESISSEKGRVPFRGRAGNGDSADPAFRVWPHALS
jgi:hypothetical protein